MPSNWNLYMEKLLSADLTVAEHKLCLALGRLLLGWKRTSAPLGEALLREKTGLDGRSFQRARDGLVDKGIVTFESGGRGRGKRSTYTLILPAKKPAPQRDFEIQEKPAPQRDIPSGRKTRSGGTKKPALQRGRIGSGKEKTPGGKTFQTQVIDAYLGAGGSLELDTYRGPLVRQATELRNAGTHETLILAAAVSLGRERGFPGYLKQRTEEIAANGGPCRWDGLDRSRLTAEQLVECGCERCTEWAATALVSSDNTYSGNEVGA